MPLNAAVWSVLAIYSRYAWYYSSAPSPEMPNCSNICFWSAICCCYIKSFSDFSILSLETGNLVFWTWFRYPPFYYSSTAPLLVFEPDNFEFLFFTIGASYWVEVPFFFFELSFTAATVAALVLSFLPLFWGNIFIWYYFSSTDNISLKFYKIEESKYYHYWFWCNRCRYPNKIKIYVNL